MNLAILPEGTISTTPKMARRCYISLPAATRFQDGPDCIAWRNGRLTSVFYVTFHLILHFTFRHCVESFQSEDYPYFGLNNLSALLALG